MANIVGITVVDDYDFIVSGSVDDVKFTNIPTLCMNKKSRMGIVGNIWAGGKNYVPAINAVDIDWNSAITPSNGNVIASSGDLIKEIDSRATKTDLKTINDSVVNLNTNIGFNDQGNWIHNSNDVITKTATTITNAITLLDKAISENGGGSASDATIEQAFTTVGKVGNLNAGTTITAGTSIVEVLKRILVAVIDVVAVKPKVTLTISPSGTPLEVGTNVTITATCAYTDGKFTGKTADYSTSQDAGCQPGNITYTPPSGNAVTTASTSYTFSSYSIGLGNNFWYAKQAYGDSQNKAKKNDGTESDASISASTTANASQKIVGQYKYFFGNYTNESDLSTMAITATSEENGITLIKSNLITAVTSGETYTIYGGDSGSITPSGFKIYLAIPSIYEISSAIGSFGDWGIANNSKDLSYTHGGTTTTYKVYYYDGTAAQEITSLIIEKS